MKIVSTKLSNPDYEKFIQTCEKDGSNICAHLRNLIMDSFEGINDSSRKQDTVLVSKNENRPMIEDVGVGVANALTNINSNLNYKQKTIDNLEAKIKSLGSGDVEAVLANGFSLMLYQLRYDFKLLKDLQQQLQSV